MYDTPNFDFSSQRYLYGGHRPILSRPYLRIWENDLTIFSVCAVLIGPSVVSWPNVTNACSSGPAGTRLNSNNHCSFVWLFPAISARRSNMAWWRRPANRYSCGHIFSFLPYSISHDKFATRHINYDVKIILHNIFNNDHEYCFMENCFK